MKKELLMSQTALFDMDGTVLDSMGCWRELNVAYAQSLHIPITPQLRAELLTLSGTQFVRYFQEHFGVKTDLDDVFARAHAAMLPQYRRGLPEKPGAKAYLERLRVRGVQRVLATATPTELARVALDHSGLTPYFDLVTTTQMIGLEKSDPAFWLAVARRAGASPASCTVYEDVLYAAEGARRAGMDVIAIEDETNARDRDALRALSLRMIASYDELP
jgi:HAD superfamily hydrolase (TIGR01509 family)